MKPRDDDGSSRHPSFNQILSHPRIQRGWRVSDPKSITRGCLCQSVRCPPSVYGGEVINFDARRGNYRLYTTRLRSRTVHPPALILVGDFFRCRICQVGVIAGIIAILHRWTFFRKSENDQLFVYFQSLIFRKYRAFLLRNSKFVWYYFYLEMDFY